MIHAYTNSKTIVYLVFTWILYTTEADSDCEEAVSGDSKDQIILPRLAAGLHILHNLFGNKLYDKDGVRTRSQVKENNCTEISLKTLEGAMKILVVSRKQKTLVF